MKNRPRSSALGKRLPPHSRAIVMLLWFVAIVAAAGVAWWLLVLTGVTDAGTSLKVVAWATIVLCLGFTAVTRRRQQRATRRR